MKDIVSLSALVNELEKLLDRSGQLSAEEMTDLHTLLELPVYRDNPNANEILFADLKDAIGSLPNKDDSTIAQYFFRLRDPGDEIGARRSKAVETVHLSSARQTRYPRQEWILGQVAYVLFARAMHPARAGWHHGDGYIFTDFTIDTWPDESLTRRTVRYSFTIQTVRNRVEFYKFGTFSRNATRIGKPRLLSKSKTQQYVASVPVDERNRQAGRWHIVRFNPKLPFGAKPTVILEEDSKVTNPTDPLREAGLTVAVLDPVSVQLEVIPTALLRVHAPRSLIPNYERNIYSLASDIMNRPLSSATIERSDDSPMTFQPNPVIAERRYVIAWNA